MSLSRHKYILMELEFDNESELPIKWSLPLYELVQLQVPIEGLRKGFDFRGAIHNDK